MATPPATPESLRAQLGHVYWIGGGSGGGKSTIARRIAATHGLHYYASDDVMADHGRRITPAASPLLQAFIAMDMNERWLNRSPETMLETFHWFQGEGFDMIIEDLLQLPKQPAVLVEGFRLLPRLVQPLLTNPRQALWLLPTPAFRQAVFASRGGPNWAFVAKTSDPERALSNLLARDALFTEHLYAETHCLNLASIPVNPSLTEDELTRQVTAWFGFLEQ